MRLHGTKLAGMLAIMLVGVCAIAAAVTIAPDPAPQICSIQEHLDVGQMPLVTEPADARVMSIELRADDPLATWRVHRDSLHQLCFTSDVRHPTSDIEHYPDYEPRSVIARHGQCSGFDRFRYPRSVLREQVYETFRLVRLPAGHC